MGRHTRKKLALPGIAATKPSVKKQGRARMAEIKREERGADRGALEARCRAAGIKPTDDNLRDVRAAWNGCAAGRAMAAQVRDEEARTTLWGAICHMRRVQAAYDLACGAPSRHPACLRLLLPVDELHADAATPAHDERTPEEKAVAATSAHQRIHEWLGWTDKPSASQALRSVIDDEPVRDAVGLVLALWCIADGHGDKRMRYRGRDAK